MEPTVSDLYKKILSVCLIIFFVYLYKHLKYYNQLLSKRKKKLWVYNQFPLIEMYSWSAISDPKFERDKEIKRKDQILK